MTNETPSKRVAMALELAGMTPGGAASAVAEVRHQVLKELYDELNALADHNNPYRLTRARRKWRQGINASLDLVFRRILQAEASTRVLRNLRMGRARNNG